MNNYSQLELLANTNQLTVRLKPCNDDLLSEIHSCINKCKGTVVPQENIEPYENMDEHSRNEYLKDLEYATIVDKLLSSSKKELGIGESYDKIIQCNFKNVGNLKNCSNEILDIISKDSGPEYWSISMNNNTLSHPGNLFIGGIPKSTSLIQLINKFKEYGSIVTLKLIFDNKNVGYGFLSYLLGSQAARCIKNLNGTKLTSKDNGESTLFINYHIERKERERLLLSHDQQSPSNSSLPSNTFIYNDHGNGRRRSSVTTVGKKCNYYLSNDELDDDFDCVFIGNLPIANFNEEEFIENINESFPDTSITSYYFPYNTSLNQFKGYGFVKVENNEQAKSLIHEINVSEFKFKDMRLIANKASQSNSNASQPYFNPYNNNNNNNNGNFYKSSSKNAYSSPPSSYGSNVQIVSKMKGYNYRYSTFNNNQPVVKPLQYLFGLPAPLSNQQESNIYVKHIPLEWSDNNLFDFYRPFGNIISCKIITVGGSPKEEEYSNDEQELPYGVSRGYGFVYFENPLDAANAVLATDGYYFEFTNQRLSVSYAQKKLKSKSEEGSHKRGIDTAGNAQTNLFQNKFYRKYNKKFLSALLNSPYYENFASKNAYRMAASIPPTGVPNGGHPHPGIIPFPVIPTGPISIVPPAGPPGGSWYTYPLYSHYNMDGTMDNIM